MIQFIRNKIQETLNPLAVGTTHFPALVEQESIDYLVDTVMRDVEARVKRSEGHVAYDAALAYALNQCVALSPPVAQGLLVHAQLHAYTP